MASVFGEHNRTATEQATTQHRLKKRRVLMSVQNLSAFSIGKLSQSFCTATIDARLTMQMFDRESILLQTLADFADLIQHSHDTTKFIAHQTQHLINQHFRPANSQRMDHVADRRTIVDRGKQSCVGEA